MRTKLLAHRTVIFWSLVTVGLSACLAPYLLGWKQLNLTWRDVSAMRVQPLGGAELPKVLVATRQLPPGTVLAADMLEVRQLTEHDPANQMRIARGKAPAQAEDVVGRVLNQHMHAGVAFLETDLTMPLRADTPVREVLLPAANAAVVTAPAWNEDLTKFPEVSLTKAVAKKQEPAAEAAEIRDQILRIKHLSKLRVDGFMAHLAVERDDLRGLPFQMGADCKMDPQVTAQFETAVGVVHRTRRFANAGVNLDCVPLTEPYLKAKVAAVVQIYGPDNEADHLKEVTELANITSPESSRAIARLAMFAPEESVRTKALGVLKSRRDFDAAPIFLEGMNYPLPAVAKRAAVAIGTLDQQTIIPKLLDLLEADDPRAPTQRTVDGKEETVIRELVRINHHRNCLLCHAPGDPGLQQNFRNFNVAALNGEGRPLQVAVPLPSESLPTPTPQGGYGQFDLPFPDVIVRTDVTYLRQDFSVMMPVANAAPWPEMQRFDFVVRTRVVDAEQAKVAREGLARHNGKRTPYQEAALDALRRLTKQDTAPTADAWRKLLNMPKPS